LLVFNYLFTIVFYFLAGVFMITYVVDAFRSYFAQWWHMSPIILILSVGVIIQLTKVLIDVIRYKKLYWDTIVSSWWFPSFHTGLSSSVAMFVLLQYGFDSIYFAIAFAFWLLFAYDAMNLRYEAGQHARYINTMRNELQSVLINTPTNPQLKERIWHTPLEVFGGLVFGSAITFVLYYIFYVVH
jgi:hypothetical protein